VSKYALILLLLLISTGVFGQKKSKVILISSTKSQGGKVGGVDIVKVYNGVWRQDFSILRSDSAYFYKAQNVVDAFGHVNINQGDTLNIYSDKLHYDGNTKIAVLTDHVVMVDKDATLTTDYFTYNTGTRIGTYTDGGKIVNKTNTLTSKNGYYFAATHDAYFRYDVNCVTSDALIKTDTMRYNSKTRINYFYGPTHIFGAKDKDTLDTDFGTYDTNTEQANFTKNNLYRQGTKSLKGDTLFYDRKIGYGRAVKHVVFNDNEQKITIYGGLGTYYKSNDLTIVTRDPYVVLVVENDSTKADSSKKIIQQSKKDTVGKPVAAPAKNTGKGKKQVVKSTGVLPGTMPIAQNKLIDSTSKKLTMPVIDSFQRKLPAKGNVDSLSKMASAQSKKVDKNTQKQLKNAAKGVTDQLIAGTNPLAAKSPVALNDTGRHKVDSVYMSADTIETRILTYKELTVIQEQERLSHIKDTSAAGKKPLIIYKKSPKVLTIEAPKWPRDTSYFHRNYFGPPKPKPVKKSKPETSVSKKKVKIDSIFITPKVKLSDTARIRILYAFHSAKIFKSDLQAKADSMFYSTSDSTIRCYTKPMIWTEGSQLSGDTVYLAMLHKKLHHMDMFPDAFIANVEKGDSSVFNQVGGKKMRGFFKNNKLTKVYVDGNAETIYFARDSATNKVTDMQRSFSSRLWVYMKDNEVTDLGFITKPDNRYIPIHIVKEDEKVLKGFIWKPKDRPVSKESIIPSYNKKRDTTKTHVAGLPRPKKMYNSKTAKGKVISKPGSPAAAADSTLKAPGMKAAPDTSATSHPKTLPGIKIKTDSLQNGNTRDTSHTPAPPLSPVLKAKKDTTGIIKE
jgi:lipopolysaccharide export system protein LptA